MKPRTLQVASILALSCLAVSALLWIVLATAPSDAGSRPVDPDDVPAQEPDPSTSGAPAGPTLVRVPVHDPNALRIVGVIVDAQNGNPIPDAHVAIHPGTGPSLGLQELASTSTQPDGKFQLDCTPRNRGVTLLTWAEGWAESRRWLSRETGIVDVGDIRLYQSGSIQGRVISESTGPVGGLDVSLWPTAAHPISPVETTVVARSFSTRTNASGVFEITGVAIPGVWSFRLPQGLEVVEPKEVSIARGSSTTHLDLIVREVSSIDYLGGVLVDEFGEPLAGVPVGALAADSVRQVARNASDTDAEGRFRIQRNRLAADDVLVSISNPAYELLSGATPVRWGTDNLRLVARRPAELDVTVHEAQTSRSIEQFSLYWQRPSDHLPGASQTRSQPEQEGSVRYLVRPGRLTILAVPRDAALTPSDPIDVDVPVQGASIDIPLLRRHPIQVLVRKSDGSGVAGSSVQLIRQYGTAELGPRGRIVSPRTVLESSPPFGVLLDEKVTGDGGHATLEGAGENLLVRALGPGHPPAQRRVTGNGPVALDVDAAFSVRGNLVPRASLDQLRNIARESELRMDLRPVNGDGWTPSQTATVAPDGGFRFLGVPSGTWQLTLQLKRQMNRFLATDLYVLPGLVEVVPGDQRELIIDVSGLVHGTLRGRVFVDADPATNVTLFLIDASAPLRSLGRPDSIGLLRSDERGVFEVVCRPGLYTVATRRADEYLMASETTRVLPGQTSEAVFRIAPQTVRIRIVEADGAPASDRIFDDGEGPIDLAACRRTDPDGWLVLDPAPNRDFDLHAFPREMGYDELVWRQGHDPDGITSLRRVVGRIEIPTGAKTVSAELQLAPDR